MRSCLLFGCSALLFLGAPAAAGPLKAGQAADAAITPAALRASVRLLSDDQLGGRAPGSPGDQLARTILASQLEGLGLLPAGDEKDGKRSYFQWLQLVGLRARLQGAPELRATSGTVPVQVRVPPADIVVFSGDQRPEAAVKDAEIVFVGYGITAPEHKWDDYKGADLRGKVLLMMNNDPEADPALFGGKTRLYYGRWDYKYREAARHGAVGAILIHTTPSASYPWHVVRSSFDCENFEAPEQVSEREPRMAFRGWLTEEASRQVARAGGQDLDKLREAAERRDFRPVPLGVRVSLGIKNEIRRLQSANVLAYLPGSDGKLRGEAVAVTAHFDHLGVRPDGKADGKAADKIYNGALDNATGLGALLAIARAATLGPAPRRSLLFGALTGEEDGLIGSEFLVKHPPAVTPTFVADVNIDGLNIYGPSREVVQIGRGKATIDAVLDAAAAAQRRKVLPDQMPDKGGYYRSDQLNFARAGVPSIYLGPPADLLGPDGKVRPGAGKERVERFIRENYHQPSDELRDDWSFEAAARDVQLLYDCALRLAADGKRYSFRPGDEFAPKR